jgi:hypothetical protein
MIDPPQVRPEEPTAVTPHGGIRGGESQQWLSYPTEPHARFGGRGGATLPDPYPHNSSARGRSSICHDRATRRSVLNFSVSVMTVAEDGGSAVAGAGTTGPHF